MKIRLSALAVLAGVVLACQPIPAFGQTIYSQAFEGGTGPDHVVDMVVDELGNVYITGFRGTGAGTTEFYTVKYSNQRDPITLEADVVWDEPWNGSVAGQHTPYAIALDGLNVYVVGSSPGSGTGLDFITIAYRKDNGGPTVSWSDDEGDGPGVRRWNHAAANGGDVARDVATDFNGNVFVTGVSVGVNGDTDFVTLKYNADGELSDTWPATGSLDPLGLNPIGVRRYNGSGDGDDVAVGIAVATGQGGTPSVYVVGTSEGAWPNGHEEDIVTIHYDREGGFYRWVDAMMQPAVARYDGAVGKDTAVACALDGGGVVVVGAVETFNPNIGNFAFGGPGGIPTPQPLFDYITLSYLPCSPGPTECSNTHAWAAQYDGPMSGYGTDIPHGMHVGLMFDGVEFQTYAWVTGLSQSSSNGYDSKTVMYRVSDGQSMWSESSGRYSGAFDDRGFAVAHNKGLGFEDTGVYVTGWTQHADGDTDIVVLKYNGFGAQQWATGYPARPIPPAVGGNDTAYRISVDPSLGHVITSGYLATPAAADDMATIRYTDP